MILHKIKALTDLLLLLTILSIPFCDAQESLINLCSNSEVSYENYTESKTDICGCELKHTCVRKCCQSGFHHFHNENPYEGFYHSICVKKGSTNFTVPIYDGTEMVYTEDTFMVGMLDCKNDLWQYFKMDNNDPRQRFYIQKNGSLYYPFHKKMYSNDRYCVDETNGLTAFLCFTTNRNDVKTERIIHLVVKSVTVSFLLITLIVYAILPEPSLHGRALICHVLSLISGNSCFAIVQYYKIHEDTFCQLLGYFITFFMLASFFWMNVMCTDIWLAFSGLRGHINFGRKLFLQCCIYAWGMPFIIVFVIFLMNTYGDKESIFYPGVGLRFCFVNGHLQIFLYYFGPILILVIINVVLFILTAINIQKVKKETSMLQRGDSQRHTPGVVNNRKKFSLYWKLLFAMGINPVINIQVIQAMSWAVDRNLSRKTSNYIFYVKNLAHILYGIFIFITYVCKKSVWKDLKKRYFLLIGRPIRANSMPQTALSTLSISEGVTSNILNSIRSKKDEEV